MLKQIIAFLFLPLGICAQPPVAASHDEFVYPGKEWQVISDPSAQGWNNNKLGLTKKFLADSTAATGVVVIQHGKILFEYGNTGENSYLASCRKSVLSMLYGPFVANGTINLDNTIGQMGLDDIGGLLPVEKKATIRHLLTARSGVYHPASNEGDATAMAPARGSVEPGSFWLYNNWDFNIAGAILEKKTGRSIYALIDSILAKPLQMQDWQMALQRKTGDTTRSKYLAYHMWFSTRDMARIGYLMLRNGKWNNKQIIPMDWVKRTTGIISSNQEALEHKTAYFNFGYGYLWWIWDKPYDTAMYKGAYTASGAFGQFITVIPSADIVIAFKTKFENGRQTPTDVYLRVVDMLLKSAQ